MADLCARSRSPLTTDFIGLASYGGGTRSSGVVRPALRPVAPDRGPRTCVIVEDIVDTGLTLSYLKRKLEARHPRSVKLCALVDKIERRQADVDIDYIGFTIPDVFVVGYGFDRGGLYRNLPHVAALEPRDPRADAAARHGTRVL